MENHTAPTLSSTNSTISSSRHGSGRNSMEISLHSRGGPPPREYRKTAREERRRETIGVIHVPGRILATLQRKFWDSNKVVSDHAVSARDFLAGVYMSSKDKAGEVAGATVHKSLQAYKFARDQSTTMELPGPLKPVRDHVLIPSFRGVERSVDFLLSPRLGQTYQQLKESGANLPLVGRAVFLPSVEAAEGVTRFVLVIVQAPLPSAESVANVAEVSMDLGKRGLRVAFRELYFYMDLIDQQVTRTMTRAQWGILGYGPYADLPLERREEVVDRACENYLSLEDPIRRYEFLAHIRWHNAALHDDLVQTGTLRARADAIHARQPLAASSGGSGGGGGSPPPPPPSPFAGDAWLDANAVWRAVGDSRRYLEGVVIEGVDEGAVGWFRRSGGTWAFVGEGEGAGGSRGPWSAFSARECRRLERTFRADAASSPALQPKGERSPEITRAQHTPASTSPNSSLPDSAKPHVANRDMEASEYVLRGSGGGRGRGGGGGEGGGGGGEGRGIGHKRGGASVVYQPTGGFLFDVHSYEVHADDVLVEQGRHAVSIGEMLMRPVFWAFSGQGDEVCRAVWMLDLGSSPYPRPAERAGVPGEGAAGGQGGRGWAGQEAEGEDGDEEEEEEGPVGLEPYPLRAAAILEDAYQFLAWRLECQGGSVPAGGATAETNPRAARASPTTVLLTVQVADQLVQFRSLTDIVSVKRTLGGAFSVFGRRRVFRGIPAAEGTETGDAGSDRPTVSSPGDAVDSAGPTATEGNDAPARGSTTSNASGADSGLEVPSGVVGEVDGGGASGFEDDCTSPTAAEHATRPAEKGPESRGREEPCRGGEGTPVDDLEWDLDERVEHLVLVVHGIGDALMSVDLGVVQLRSLVECCDTMRAHHEEVVLNSNHLRGLRKHGKKAARAQRGGPSGGSSDTGASQDRSKRKGLGRVEFLPVEWHTRFKGRLYREGGGGGGGNAARGDDTGRGENGQGCTDQRERTHANVRTRGDAQRQGAGAGVASRSGGGVGVHGDGGRGDGAGAGGLSIWDITLPRAPTLRAFTNDTLLDILYFMSPEYHQVIVEEVTQEMNRVLALFRKHTRSWTGKVSIVAHSLGAIVCFDIMANQPPKGSSTTPPGDDEMGGVHDADPSVRTSKGFGGGGSRGTGGGGGGCLRYYRGSTTFPALSTHVENVFCLGSPIGMFLMIRGQHRGLGKAFSLPGCRRLFNVFHPYDPVAFRLEPLLKAGGGDGNSSGAAASWGGRGEEPSPPEEPVILPTWTGGLRVHYQVQRWWQDLWSRAWETKRRAEASIERSLEAIGLIDEQPDDGSDFHESLFSPSPSDVPFARVEQVLEEASLRAMRAQETAAAATATAAAAGSAIGDVLLEKNITAVAQQQQRPPKSTPSTLPPPPPSSPHSPTRHNGRRDYSHSDAFRSTGTSWTAVTSSASATSMSTPVTRASSSAATGLEVNPHEEVEAKAIPPGEEGRGYVSRTESDLEKTRSGLENTVSDMHRTASSLEKTKSEPEKTESDLELRLENEVDTSGEAGATTGTTSACQRAQDEGKGEPSSEKAVRDGRGGGEATRPTRAARKTWPSGVMEEDLERNGALAGGRRVDYCLQEKEFEVTNEYIFALGSHVIYWSSKDVSLFIAQQVVADAVAADDGAAAAQAAAAAGRGTDEAPGSAA